MYAEDIINLYQTQTKMKWNKYILITIKQAKRAFLSENFHFMFWFQKKRSNLQFPTTHGATTQFTIRISTVQLPSLLSDYPRCNYPVYYQNPHAANVDIMFKAVSQLT